MHSSSINITVKKLICLLASFTLLLTLPTMANETTANHARRAEPAEGPPGLPRYSKALRDKLAQGFAMQGKDYRPRTEYLLHNGGPVYTNRLILEGSPYLIQHAHNPINWYAWGDEALTAAKAQDKPILLSIGYSTCHWCHVMERESFDNETIATLINEKFIAIKVDRERRPDLDEVYMTAVQITTGRGGWPMTSMLNSEGKPFYSGTYFPPGQFVQLLNAAAEAWNSKREAINKHANSITVAVQGQMMVRNNAQRVPDDTVETTVNSLMARFDELSGGFSPAPKFPQESLLLMMADHIIRSGDQNVLNAFDVTLDAMARGGIYDQIGGGFHRYSTDPTWLVPHFEKMLYNQSQLARAYTKAFEITGNDFYQRIVEQTLHYVLTDMLSAEGVFYSAEDADSEGEEGRFYVWTVTELQSLLNEEEFEFAKRIFDITPEGNFEGHSIPNLSEPLDTFALDRQRLYAKLDSLRQKLYPIRDTREHPLRDDKIVTAWNALMITAFAEASRVFDNSAFLNAAIKAADYIWQAHRKAGRLFRTSLNGRTSAQATQEDYAYLGEAMLALYDVTGDQSWLDKAGLLADDMLALFDDQEQGGLYMTTASTDNNLIVRPKSSYDGAMASGNSVGLNLLAGLSKRAVSSDYDVNADRTLGAFSESLRTRGAAHGYMLKAMDDYRLGGTSGRQYAGGGIAKIDLQLNRNNDDQLEAKITLQLDKGWHVNSAKPDSDNLIATNIALTKKSGWEIESVTFPQAKEVKLGFQDKPLLVYENSFDLHIKLKQTSDVTDATVRIPMRLTLQTCSDEVCLLPETVVLYALQGMIR